MMARAHFSFQKSSLKRVQSRPSVKFSFDIENQDGCMEIAKWKIENGKAVPRTKATLVLANKNIKSFAIKIGPENFLVEIKWNSDSGVLAVDSLNGGRYICEGIDSHILDRHIEFMARENPKYFCNAIVDIEFSHYPFFAEMIKCFTRNTKDASNFADPPNPTAIIDTINCDRQTYEFKNFKEKREHLKGIRGYANITTRKGRSPERQYVIDVKLFQDRPEDYKANEILRSDYQMLFISSDFATMYDTYRNKLQDFKIYSDKYEAATSKAKSSEIDISQEMKNLGNILQCHFGRKVTWFGIYSNQEDDSESTTDDSHKLCSPLYPSNDFDIFSDAVILNDELTGDAKAINELLISSEKTLAQSESNVHTYFSCRAPAQRGMDIELDLLKQAIASGTSRSKLIDAIRDGVDRKMIPANHWAGLREDPRSEPFQNIISNVMNYLSVECKIANPISFIRSTIYTSLPKYLLTKAGKPNPTKSEYQDYLNAALYSEGWKLYLQFGFGNCGEHAQVCYHAFKTLMENGTTTNYKKLFKNIIYTGHLFTDHAFLVGGFELSEVRYRKAKPSAMYWDIEEIVRKLKTAKKEMDAFVVDAYMQNVRSMNLEDFLTYLLTQQARNADDREMLKYARFVDQYPEKPPVVIYS